MKSFDAVVIGGGPAGATAARFLARAGLRVALVERDLNHKKPCGGGIPSSAFKEFGLSEDAVIQKIDKICFISPSDKKTDIKLSGGTINIVDRLRFDRQLRDMACTEGVELIHGDFRDFEGLGKKVIIEVFRKKGNSMHIMADYVIGCDGVNSRVRRALGLIPVKYVLTFSERMKVKGANSCEFWFGSRHAENSYSWVFPEGEGYSLGTGVRDPKKLRINFNNFLERRGCFTRGSGRGYKIPSWADDVFAVKRVLLSGDAASQVMPLTYEGIYYAMKSAQFASEAVIEGRVSLYKKLWNDRFHRRFLFMKRLEEYFLKNDQNTEKLLRMFENRPVQKASMELWLSKRQSKSSLFSYIKLFGKYLH